MATVRATVRAAVLGGAVLAGAAVAQEAPQPSATSAQYGNWTLRCQAVADAPADAPRDVCDVRTTVMVRGQQGETLPLVQVALVGASDGGYLLSVQVPAAAYLRAPVQFALDAVDTPWLEASYVRCVPSGCLADATVTAEQAADLAGAEAPRVSFVMIDQRRFSVPLVQTGLREALQAMASR